MANIGYDGTDNDVTAKLCVGTACCTTHTLNSIWTNDWSSMDEETWGASWLGQCSGTTFRVSRTNFFRIFVSNVFSTYSLEKWIESHDSETLKRLWI